MSEGSAVKAVRENGVVSVSGVMGGNMAAANEIRATGYEPGTLGHMAKFPMNYSFSDRMAGTKRIQAGEPLETMTEYTVGAGGCCMIL